MTTEYNDLKEQTKYSKRLYAALREFEDKKQWPEIPLLALATEIKHRLNDEIKAKIKTVEKLKVGDKGYLHRFEQIANNIGYLVKLIGYADSLHYHAWHAIERKDGE